MASVAIETKFLGPTDTRGSRIKAFMRETPWRDDQPKSVTLGYRHDLNGPENHKAAAQELVKRIGFTEVGRLVMGATDKGYVFVPVWKGDIPGHPEAELIAPARSA